MLTIAAFLAHNCCASFLSLWPEVSAKGIFCASSSFQQQEYWRQEPCFSLPASNPSGTLFSSRPFSTVNAQEAGTGKGLGVSFNRGASALALKATSVSLKGGGPDSRQPWMAGTFSARVCWWSSAVFHLLLPAPSSHFLKQSPSFFQVNHKIWLIKTDLYLNLVFLYIQSLEIWSSMAEKAPRESFLDFKSHSGILTSKNNNKLT